ncbi:MAG: sigma-70 family RNA polymerase sigma factor [Tunicatimonas sp.]
MEQPFIRTISEHQAIIHRVCRMYRDTLEDREDLFQEIVYQLWKSFPSFRERSRITTWMYRIALSTAMAKYRKRSAAVRTTTLDGIEVATLATSETHPKQELLHRAIATLSDAEKAVITLYLDDYRYEEIAQIIGISTNHVGVKLNRIKQKLAHQLNPQDHET